MYEFLDDNAGIEAHPVSYTNFPPNIARNHDMISVNSTIEIDLTGQCCSESIGAAQFSGTGGQHDFARGAFDAQRRRAFALDAHTHLAEKTTQLHHVGLASRVADLAHAPGAGGGQKPGFGPGDRGFVEVD